MSNAFCAESNVSLQGIKKIEHRIFKNEIVQYFITYLNSNEEIFVMGLFPNGKLVFNKSYQEWYGHPFKQSDYEEK